MYCVCVLLWRTYVHEFQDFPLISWLKLPLSLFLSLSVLFTFRCRKQDSCAAFAHYLPDLLCVCAHKYICIIECMVLHLFEIGTMFMNLVICANIFEMDAKQNIEAIEHCSGRVIRITISRTKANCGKWLPNIVCIMKHILYYQQQILIVVKRDRAHNSTNDISEM